MQMNSMIPHRRRKRRSTKQFEGNTPPMSPVSAPLPPLKLPNSVNGSFGDRDDNKKLRKGSPTPNSKNHQMHHSINKRGSIRRTRTTEPSSTVTVVVGDPNSCWEFTGMNFIVPALCIWTLIILVVWYPELKDNALDYYYLQYPEQQPLSPIRGTILPLIPSVWVYDPDKNKDIASGDKSDSAKKHPLKQEVQKHLREHRQPHYFMLPQDFYDQQPPSDNLGNSTSADGSNTALEAPPIRGVLIVLHGCHQSGLHFFQLPESRIVAAHALQRGLAVFSPSASSAASLAGTKNKNSIKARSINMGDKEKHCWSASLDGDELLGPLLYEWVREIEGLSLSLPRMAIGINNGANLVVDSSLYKALRLQSIALYGSHHPVGFDASDLERDIVPPTAFVVFPKNKMATMFARQQFSTLEQQEDEDEDEEQKLRKEEEKAELEKEQEEEDGDDDSNGSQDKKPKKMKAFFRKTELYSVEPHAWTPALCQARLPEYHTRCRSFFRHVAKFQKKKQRKVEAREMKRDPQQRLKRLRLGGLYNAKQKYQLISSKGEVLQSSKSSVWEAPLESLGLDDWTTHIMAFTLASSGRTKSGNKKRVRQKKTQLMQFPTTATPEGRSWLWASMLQEIEVAFGMQEMTAEYSMEILDFLMHHAGLSLRGGD